MLEVGNLKIDQGRREVTIGARQVELRAKEFDLLVAFVENFGLVLDRETLLRIVWGYDRERLLQLAWGHDFYGDIRTIDVHVTWLRDKLEGASVRIQTIRGIGYKLVSTDVP